MLYLLQMAYKAANLLADKNRKAIIGAVAVRKDGVIVSSRNGATPNPCGISPTCHAERRIMNKCGYGAIIYVARTRRDGSIGCAKPCKRCIASMHSMGVKKVYYTITGNEYGVIYP